ncbi:MAG TPA: hypothetical protein VMF04_04980 [Thermoplasmata archaeon]|nr:hypothetical protein [Thermoplasmata archaeon]
MRTPASRSIARSGRWLGPLVALAVAVLLLVPLGTVAAPTAERTVSVTPGASSGGLTANVSWDGTNITTAASASSAFRISFGNSVNLYYAWRQPSGVLSSGAPWSINDARLQIFYFGFALGTRDVTTATGNTSGSIVMSNWNTGPLQYVIEGTYQLTASLLAPNGTTAWSQTFWVQVAAAFYVLAALPIVLILLVIYELYNVATVGKQQALKVRKSGTSGNPPPAAPESTSSPSSAPPASTPSDPSSTPPPGGSS